MSLHPFSEQSDFRMHGHKMVFRSRSMYGSHLIEFCTAAERGKYEKNNETSITGEIFMFLNLILKPNFATVLCTLFLEIFHQYICLSNDHIGCIVMKVVLFAKHFKAYKNFR